MVKPLYEIGDLVTVNKTASVDYAYGLMGAIGKDGRVGTIQKVKIVDGATPRYRVYFDFPECLPMQFAQITWLRESSLDPVNPRTLRQQVRATKQLALF